MKFPSLPRRHEPDALALAQGNPHLERAVLRSRQLLRKRALVAGVAGAVPLPGLMRELSVSINTAAAGGNATLMAVA